MDEYTLTRTGDRPLRFRGEEIASANTRAHQGPCENRYWSLTLYRSGAGGYVAHVSYSTQWQGELDREDVYRATDAAGIAAALRGHDPLSQVSRLVEGYSSRETSRETLRLTQLRQCWEKGLGEVLGGIEPEEAD